MELKQIIEALLFSAQKPLSPLEMRDLLKTAATDTEEEAPKAFRKVKVEELHPVLDALAAEVDTLERPYRLACVAGSWQYVSRAEYGPWLRALYGVKSRPPRLSQPALETLAIIAYRQPLTRAEMEQIRGVSVDGVMQTLMERGLAIAVGKAEAPGRPSLYATTPQFLEYFGLNNLDDLPAADELRRLPTEKPESLLTVDPGLATAPPEELAESETAETPEPTAPAEEDTAPAPGSTESPERTEPPIQS